MTISESYESQNIYVYEEYDFFKEISYDIFISSCQKYKKRIYYLKYLFFLSNFYISLIKLIYVLFIYFTYLMNKFLKYLIYKNF